MFEYSRSPENLPAPRRISTIVVRNTSAVSTITWAQDPASQVIRARAKGMRRPRLEDAKEDYQSLPTLYDKKIYPSVDGIRNLIRLLGTTNEKIRRLKAEEWVGDSVPKNWRKKAGSNCRVADYTVD